MGCTQTLHALVSQRHKPHSTDSSLRATIPSALTYTYLPTYLHGSCLSGSLQQLRIGATVVNSYHPVTLLLSLLCGGDSVTMETKDGPLFPRM